MHHSCHPVGRGHKPTQKVEMAALEGGAAGVSTQPLASLDSVFWLGGREGAWGQMVTRHPYDSEPTSPSTSQV